MSEINIFQDIPISDLERIIKGIETNYYQKESDGVLLEGETDQEVERLIGLHNDIMFHYLPDVNDDREAVFLYSIEKIKEAIKSKQDGLLDTNTNG
jgi:hypothetical protein